ALHHARAVHHDHDGRPRVGVDAEDSAQVHLEPGLLPRLAHRPVLDRLAPVHEASGKRPLPTGGLNRAAREEHPPLVLGNGGGHDLVVQVEDEGAAGAHHLLLALGRHGAALESDPTQGAEADALRRELMMDVRVTHGSPSLPSRAPSGVDTRAPPMVERRPTEASGRQYSTPPGRGAFMRCRHIVLSALVSLMGLALLSLAFVSWSEGQATQGEYKIGVLEPLTGPLAFEGKRHIDGYEVMRDLINAQGGVMGKKLVFVVGDATDPTAAASEVNRLITREGVKIITGTYSSTLCGAASEAASRQNVIYWESSCVDPRYSKRGLKNVFRTE